MDVTAEQLAAAIFEAECGQPPSPWVTKSQYLYASRVQTAERALAILERDRQDREQSTKT
jgi:hypothetical protein